MTWNLCRPAALAALLTLIPAAHAQQTWTSADKAVSFTFPAGWESVDGTDYAAFYEVYEDGEMTANCFVEGFVLDNPPGFTQASYNDFTAARTPDTLDLPSSPKRFDATRVVSGVAILEYGYEQDEDDWPLDYSVAQFGLVNGDTSTSMSLTCVGPLPMSGRVTGDIRKIMSSLQIKR